MQWTPEILESARAELAERSLRHFSRQAWAVVEPKTPFKSNWHIDAICEHLEACRRREIRQLLINIPPRCCKSTLCSVFYPAWVWITDPWERFMCATYSANLSRRDSTHCRYLIQSTWYQSRWGDRFRLMGDQNEKSKFENDRFGSRIATSVGAMTTGEGGSHIIIDDPHNVREALSNKERQEAIDWWDLSMSTRANDPANSVAIVIMQRIHESDLAGHLLSQGGWEHLLIPMEYESQRAFVTSIGWSDPRKEDGELMWPAHITSESLDQHRKSPVKWSSQYMQRPSPAGGSIFLRENFRYFEHDEPSGVFVLRSRDGGTVRVLDDDRCRWFQCSDTAQTASRSSCYTVVGTFVLTPCGRILVYDVWRARVEVPKQFNALVEVRKRFPKVAFQAVENRMSGVGLIQQGRLAGFPLLPLDPGSADKVSRAATVSTFYQNGSVYHREGAPWLGDFEDELLVFPNGENDDQVDVVAYAGMLTIQNAILLARRDEELFYSGSAETPEESDAVRDFLSRYGTA